ncbi:hypothetical protein Slin15195_G014060 [Septoria linicola]|uniref:Uncharacterized protein n=1 Tax=Septoria linicola TaxID=215465 RepID=A0A9Q9AL80_9PEZI|nr:hypothetical protein Slin15195_G014060 [Septoria linicola]
MDQAGGYLYGDPGPLPHSGPFVSNLPGVAAHTLRSPRTLPSHQTYVAGTETSGLQPSYEYQHVPYISETPLVGSPTPWQQYKGKGKQKVSCGPRHVVESFLERPRHYGQYDFQDGRAAVLGVATVFNPWHTQDQQANWPSWEEMKYEGKDRIATDRLHRRFLCVPRVKGNLTVGWQQRRFVGLNPLEDFTYPVPHAVDVLLRTHNIPDIDPTDAEGVHFIGAELLGKLDYPTV